MPPNELPPVKKPTNPGPEGDNGSGLPSTDPEKAARNIKKMFKKVTQEINPTKYGMANVLVALQKAIGLSGESFTAIDQKALVEFFGAEAAARVMLLQEDTPAISPSRARVLTNWFDVFMKAVREGAEREYIWRLGKKLGIEYINALADKSLRG